MIKMKRNLFKIVSILGICLILFSLVVIITKTPDPKPKAGSIDIIEKAKLNPNDFGGDFILLDQDGNEFDSRSLRGKYQLIYFGFTNCPDICPASIVEIKKTIDFLKSKNPEVEDLVQPIFITVDPKRDTSMVLKDYFESMGINIIALTGTQKNISDVAKMYRVFYSKAAGSRDKDDYMVNHSSFFYLVGPDGKFIKHYVPNATGEQIAKDLEKIVSSQPNE